MVLGTAKCPSRFSHLEYAYECDLGNVRALVLSRLRLPFQYPDTQPGSGWRGILSPDEAG
jgi:hypothetical protein